MDNIEIIKKSRSLLEGNWVTAIAVVLINSLLTGVPQNVDRGFSILVILIAGALNVGVSFYFLNISRGSYAGIENMFDGFRKYIPATIAFIATVVVVMLGFVLLIIPGVILILGLSQTFFIIADDDSNISGIDAMKKSWEMMDGYKMKYFLLSLIHFCMIILGLLLLVIGIFYMLPIIYNSMALFYDLLKKGELQAS